MFLEVKSSIYLNRLVSSPEHEVLMASFSGQSMSVVRRSSRRQQLL